MCVIADSGERWTHSKATRTFFIFFGRCNCVIKKEGGKKKKRKEKKIESIARGELNGIFSVQQFRELLIKNADLLGMNSCKSDDTHNLAGGGNESVLQCGP